MADVVARLLFDRPDRLERLRGAVYSLSHDRSTAVRSCAIRALLAVLDVDPQTAISWFLDCVSAEAAILETHDVERFIRFAGHGSYAAVQPVLDAMLKCTLPGAVEAGSRQTCLLALSLDAAGEDAQRILKGTAIMRKAAAEVYAANAADQNIGATCRRLLIPLFADPDNSVRAAAGTVFRDLASLATPDQAELLQVLLEASPGPAVLASAVHALEDSSVQLPDLVCRLAEACIEAYRAGAGDISSTDPMVARDLSKIVVRLYAQTEDPAIQARCLDLIDEMERHDFFGLSEELQRLER